MISASTLSVADLLWVFDCGSWYTTPLWEGEVRICSFHSTPTQKTFGIVLYINSVTSLETCFTCRSKDCQKDLNIQRLGQTTPLKLWRKHGRHCRTSKKEMLCSLSQILLWNVQALHRRSCTCQTLFSERYLNLIMQWWYNPFYTLKCGFTS